MAIIAIATDGDQVAGHFGRCPGYTLVTVENGKETARQAIQNPGHEPGFLPKFLHEKGAGVIVAGGMGPMAVNLFNQIGIEVVMGIGGPIDDVVQAYIDGTLNSGQNICDH
jgi:predicted Fe-Mo cluster-binding NifX family protein